MSPWPITSSIRHPAKTAAQRQLGRQRLGPRRDARSGRRFAGSRDCGWRGGSRWPRRARRALGPARSSCSVVEPTCTESPTSSARPLAHSFAVHECAVRRPKILDCHLAARVARDRGRGGGKARDRSLSFPRRHRAPDDELVLPRTSSTARAAPPVTTSTLSRLGGHVSADSTAGALASGAATAPAPAPSRRSPLEPSFRLLIDVADRRASAGPRFACR